MKKYNSRKDVPEKYKWDLTDFYKNDNDFENSYNNIRKTIKKLEDYKGCTKDAIKLYEYLLRNRRCGF